MSSYVLHEKPLAIQGIAIIFGGRRKKAIESVELFVYLLRLDSKHNFCSSA